MTDVSGTLRDAPQGAPDEGRPRMGGLCRLHGWLALLFALPLLLVTLSGALLGFARESDRIFNVDLLTAPFSASAPLPPARWLEIARQTHPEMRIIGLGFPITPVDTALVLMEDAAGKRHEVHVHPRTGEPRGSRPVDRGLYSLAWHLHTTLLLGETGRWMTRLAAVGLLLTILSGLLLHGRTQARGIAGRTHPLLGMTTAPMLALIAASGLLFLAWQPSYGNVQHLTLHTPTRPFDLPDPTPALTALHTAQPTCAPRWLAPLAQERVLIACETPHHAGTLGIHWFTWSASGGLVPETGEGRAGELFYGLHTGELLGMPGRILWVIASLAVPFLILGGLASRSAHRDPPAATTNHDA
ncbi:MAG: PepSY-associated TM helix domain-containing protein [Halothiobacillaceae bacterium]